MENPRSPYRASIAKMHPAQTSGYKWSDPSCSWLRCGDIRCWIIDGDRRLRIDRTAIVVQTDTAIDPGLYTTTIDEIGERVIFRQQIVQRDATEVEMPERLVAVLLKTAFLDQRFHD